MAAELVFKLHLCAARCPGPCVSALFAKSAVLSRDTGGRVRPNLSREVISGPFLITLCLPTANCPGAAGLAAGWDDLSGGTPANSLRLKWRLPLRRKGRWPWASFFCRTFIGGFSGERAVALSARTKKGGEPHSGHPALGKRQII